MIVCRSGRMLFTILVTCGPNPPSKSRSASSRTHIVARCVLTTLPLFATIKSTRRPGVPMRMCAPLRHSAMCCEMGTPPYAATLLSRSWEQNFVASVWICIASSWVGTMTQPMGPSISASDGWSKTCRSMGRM
eukprot:gene13176-biopygen13226